MDFLCSPDSLYVSITQSRHTIRCIVGAQYSELPSHGLPRLTVSPASESPELAHVTPSFILLQQEASDVHDAVSISGMESAESDDLEVG